MKRRPPPIDWVFYFMETFKKIEGFENYEISNLGRVLNTNTGRFIKQFKDTNGYYNYFLSKNGKRKIINTHRLLAIYFIPKEQNRNIVNHIDQNKLNNDLSNLEWVNNRENNSHCSISLSKYSKYVGVSFDKQRMLFTSKIKINGKLINLGRFKTEFEAYNKRCEYEKENNIVNKYL